MGRDKIMRDYSWELVNFPFEGAYIAMQRSRLFAYNLVPSVNKYFIQSAVLWRLQDTRIIGL